MRYRNRTYLSNAEDNGEDEAKDDAEDDSWINVYRIAGHQLKKDCSCKIRGISIRGASDKSEITIRTSLRHFRYTRGL